jgi:hypothetical protein
MNFVTIDFETADYSRKSACSLEDFDKGGNSDENSD